MKRIFILLVINCLTVLCVCADGQLGVTPDQVAFPLAKSPEGIYFQNKGKTSAISQQSLSGFSSSNSGSSYSVKQFDKLEKSVKVNSGASNAGYTGMNMKVSSSSGIQSSFSFSSINLSRMSEGMSMSPQAFDSPFADNPSTDGPGGSITGGVEAHVGAPVGNGIYILILLTVLLISFKSKRSIINLLNQQILKNSNR